MPHSVQAYGAGEVEAYNANSPIIVGHNVLRDAIDARWTSTGTQGGTDLTNLAARYAWDGRGSRITNFIGSAATLYFNVQIPASVIDTIAIIFDPSFTSSTVTVQIADDANFTTNVVTFAGPFLSQSGCRIARTFGGTRYAGVEYIRIRFVPDSGSYNTSIAPQIVEVFVGRGSALSQWWGYGNDSEPSRSKSVDYEPPTGDVSRHLHHYGRHVARHSQVLSLSAQTDLDDVATLRGVLSASLHHGRPVLYLPRPLTEVNRALLGFPPMDGLNLPQTEYETYDCSWEFDEQPPFYDNETCTALPAGFANEYSYIFDGVGDYIDFGDVANFDGATACTWSSWIYQDPVNTGQFIWAKRTNLSQHAFSIATATGNTIEFRIEIPSVGRTPNNSLTAGWHHVVCVFNGPGADNESRMQVYIDSVIQTLSFTGTIPSSIPSGTTSSMHIGAQNGSAAFEGNLDELACWVGTAADQTQVDELYNGGAPGDVAATSLGTPTFWYRADPDSGSTAVDQGSAGVNGTYQGNTARDTNVP